MSELKASGKMSQLMFWNKQNNSNSSSSNTSNKDNDGKESKNAATKDETKKNKRNWLHTPEALISGHVVYLVKFFGNLPVEQPKGIEIVKDTIRKLQFAQQMKKAETGTQEKFKKVEITISVDGVAVQEPHTQKILHQFPLHNISYCADEKGVKKFFSFIAKSIKTVDGSSSSNGCGSSVSDSSSSVAQQQGEETHECFVFISNKLASDITLTIGQAFELAFRKYINCTEKTELSKAQQQISDLEKIITIFKDRLNDLSKKVSKNDLDALLFKWAIKDILEVPPVSTSNDVVINDNTASMVANGGGKLINDSKMLIDSNSSHLTSTCSTIPSKTSSTFLPIVPPRANLPSQITTKSNSQKMEELLLNSDSDSDFDPRAEESNTDGHSTTSSGGGGSKNMSNDLFGFEPSKSFGQQLFYNNNNNKQQNNSNANVIATKNSSAVSQSFSELNMTPPLLAPPPKASAPRRSTSTTTTTTNNNAVHNNNTLINGTDLFGSDPFDINTSSIFPKQISKISVDDFTLESLDPLRK
uniref:Adaptor protein CED-6 n=1 Tax=Glossina morsitans morsitans TaxID=37546 RepID=D3TPR4_GLOMM